MGCVGQKTKNDHHSPEPPPNRTNRTTTEPSIKQSKPKAEGPADPESVPVPAEQMHGRGGFARAQFEPKQSILQKYNIHVKDSSNRVLSVNSYSYQTLLNHNPTVIEEAHRDEE